MEDRREGERRIFTFGEAALLMPEIRRLTEAAHGEVEALRARLDSGDAAKLQAEASRIVESWTEGVRALGADVKGLWLVDFDNGSGYYCWQWPEANLEYYHSYDEGFRGRMRIH